MHAILRLEKSEEIALMFLIELTDCHFSGSFGEFDNPCTQGVFLLNFGGFGIGSEVLNNLLEIRFEARLQDLDMFHVGAIDCGIVIPSIENVTFSGRVPLLTTYGGTRHDSVAIVKKW
jgi:hypothetical protein